MWDKKKNEEEMDDLIVVSRQGDSLPFFSLSLFMSVKLETASNWTVMLFYKHLFSFWKQYICFYSCSVIIVWSSFSLFFSLWVSSFRPYRSQKRKEKRHHFYCCCLFSLFLSQPKILPASVYTYISIRRSASVCAPFFFLLVLAKFGSCITTILILLFAFAYIYVQE